MLRVCVCVCVMCVFYVCAFVWVCVCCVRCVRAYVRARVRCTVESAAQTQSDGCGALGTIVGTHGGKNKNSKNRVCSLAHCTVLALTGTTTTPRQPCQIGTPRSYMCHTATPHLIVIFFYFFSNHIISRYYKLIEEMRAAQAQGVNKTEWISWHEGCHLVTKAPEASPTFKKLLAKMREYFNVRDSSVGVRFNWYQTSRDWKVRLRRNKLWGVVCWLATAQERGCSVWPWLEG